MKDEANITLQACCGIYKTAYNICNRCTARQVHIVACILVAGYGCVVNNTYSESTTTWIK